jgi:hypothetical protein
LAGTNKDVKGDMDSMIGSGASWDSTHQTMIDEEADIKRFLSRKIRINSLSFNTVLTEDTFDPWIAFLSNLAVRRKLANYLYVRGDLHLEFQVSGTPFIQNQVLVSYCYMNIDRSSTLTYPGLWTRSQRKNLILEGCSSRGGCLVLPFMYPYDYLPSNGDNGGTYVSPGSITMENITEYTTVDGSTTSMQVTVFAHMTNVELVAPTQFVASSEFTNPGAVSAAASAVAAAAGHIKDLPVIGSYARATEIGAKGLGAMASLFGFSRPINVRERNWMRPGAMFALGNSDADDNSEQLALTMKNELSIDPSTAGCDDQRDLLAFDNLVKIPSYIGGFNWEGGNFVSAVLAVIPVTPPTSLTSPSNYVASPVGYVAMNFDYWRGTLEYNFHFVASQLSRGVIAIVYEPSNAQYVAFSESGNPFNTNYVTTLDLSVARTVKVKVPWMQMYPYKQHIMGQGEVGVPTGAPDAESCNGSLVIMVVNPLRQPNSSPNAVSCWVTCNGGDDMEFGSLKRNRMEETDASFIASSEIVPGSSEGQDPVSIPDREENTTEASGVLTTSFADAGTSLSPERPLVYFGESVRSFRMLLKRYYLWRVNCWGSAGLSYGQFLQYTAFPCFRSPESLGDGPDSGGYWVFNTPIHLCAVMFAGWRGSIKYKINTSTTNPRGMFITRQNAAVTPISSGTVAGVTSSKEGIQRYDVTLGNVQSGYARATRQNPQLEFSVPYQGAMRFSILSTHNRVGDYAQGSSVRFSQVNDTPPNNGTNEIHVAGGEDLTFFGFNGVPLMFISVV